MSTVSKKQQASVNKYIKGNYDRVNLTLPKGRKDELQFHAMERCESLNGFINRAIDETIERDKHPGPQAATTEIPQPPNLVTPAAKAVPHKDIKDIFESADSGITPTPGRDNPEPDIRYNTPTSYKERRDYQNSVKPAAYQDYLADMPAKDIAAKYGISVKAVSAWFGHWGRNG